MTRATKKLMALCDTFEEKLVKRGERIRQEKKQKAEKNKQTSQQVSGKLTLYSTLYSTIYSTLYSACRINL